MRRTGLSFVVLAFAGLIAIAPAKAQDKSLEGVPVAPQIVAEISVSGQSMSVRVDGIVRYTWDVSTARRGFITPKGTFGVQSMRRMHYSSLFNNAPMPFSIFYSGHYAIHGTTEVQRLGQPASAGCVRLHPDNAKTLFEMVQERGPKSLQVVVTS